MAMTFQHLFTPFRLGHVTLRNRIVSTPHATRFGKDGYITERYIRYHQEKARGGAGLVQCFGSSSVHPSSPVLDWNGIKNWDDSSLPTFEAFARAIHAEGAHVMAQTTHRGRRGSSGPGEQALVSPSDVPETENREIPHALDRSEIAEIVQAYAAAALRLKRAGFDGADLCAYARHLIDQFWVPSVNRRTDEYGGSLENRLRFAVEVVGAIRAAVGRDFVLGMRVSGDELIPDGLHLEDVVEIVRALDSLGQLDYFTVSGSTGETPRFHQKLMPFADAPQGVYASLAARIKQEVRAAVIYAGRVVDPGHAERLLDEGACDLVAMTRALMADPWMPRKAAGGHLDDVRMCVGMQEGCLGRSNRGLTLSCSQNPVTGREGELGELVPAAVPRRIVVIGGGPAGLEAARVAALRGHEVILYERTAALGGQVLVAARAPLRPGYGESITWLVRQLRKTTATVRLGTEATLERVLADRPDAVIVATGAVPRRPDVPGADLPGVVTVEDILSGAAIAGPRVVVVDGTGRVQAGLAADYLAVQGRAVSVLTVYHTVCDNTEGSTKEPLFERLYQRDVAMIVDTALAGIEADGTGRLRVLAANEYSGRELRLDAVDTVVLAYGARAVDALFAGLKGRVPETVLVGDAMAPRLLHDALLEGTRAARRL
jgi:2,4-dienoyl-CoA reductase-like NADH-dependent reductase (Old Yellow Enzyme family)/NADPH-dependent 2,4-dienoyl-CoA reductase/sulfur reductase-like enzyme